jgi:hypothetical protein
MANPSRTSWAAMSRPPTVQTAMTRCQRSSRLPLQLTGPARNIDASASRLRSPQGSGRPWSRQTWRQLRGVDAGKADAAAVDAQGIAVDDLAYARDRHRAGAHRLGGGKGGDGNGSEQGGN